MLALTPQKSEFIIDLLVVIFEFNSLSSITTEFPICVCKLDDDGNDIDGGGAMSAIAGFIVDNNNVLITIFYLYILFYYSVCIL